MKAELQRSGGEGHRHWWRMSRAAQDRAAAVGGRKTVPSDRGTDTLSSRDGARLSRLQATSLVVLGDSIAYGWGVRYAESFPALLQESLRRLPAGGAPWHVVNAGMPGDTVLMGYARYAQDVRPFHPKVLLISFGLNDGALRRTPVDTRREMSWLVGRRLGRLVAWLARRLAGTIARWRGRSQVIVTREAQPRVRPWIFQACLSQLVRRARRDGATVHLMPLIPLDERVLPPAQIDSYRRYDSCIGQIARRTGTPLIELGTASRSEDEPFQPDSMSARDGVHLTAIGQAWLAAKVSAHINALVMAQRSVKPSMTGKDVS